METTVKDRLILFIESKGISKNAFERACGLSTRYVSNMRQSIQPDKVKKIALIFPELNTGWLLTGEGEMLKGKADELESQPVPTLPEVATEEKTSFDGSLIEYLQRKIDELEKEKASLLQENAVLQYENRMLASNKGESAGNVGSVLSADVV